MFLIFTTPKKASFGELTFAQQKPCYKQAMFFSVMGVTAIPSGLIFASIKVTATVPSEYVLGSVSL